MGVTVVLTGTVRQPNPAADDQGGSCVSQNASSLDQHREAVDRALTEAGLGWDTWPEVAAAGPLADRDRLSALLLLLAVPQRRRDVPGGAQIYLDDGVEVIERLRRRRLPWDRTTARLALAVVTEREDFDDLRVAVALQGAMAVCAAGAADTLLLDELDRCAVWLDALSPELWRVPEMRLRLRQVRAAAAPPDLLDLSMLRAGDAWGAQAAEAARALPADDLAPLVRRLGELGARKPSQAWLRSVEECLRPDAARELVEAWLQLAAVTDVVPPDDAAAFSGGMLFTYDNEHLVRAAVLATRSLTDAPWVPVCLGVLARRGAATSGRPGMTASLALKVAGAAVDTLAARGTPADRVVLGELLEDLSRRDLVKRVGAALGREGRAGERDATLRKDKASAVRRKADPSPRRARAAVDVLLRRHLGPELRRLGFTGGPRSWRRLHPDRVDVIALGSHDEDRLSVSYGTRFDAAHPDGEPFPVEREKARDYHLDVRVTEDWPSTAAELDRCAEHIESAVIPFLDSLGRYELVLAYLQRGAGAPPSAEALDGPGDDGLLGLLASAAGDRPTAVAHLEQRVAATEDWASDSYVDPDVSSAAVRFWSDQLERARRLP